MVRGLRVGSLVAALLAVAAPAQAHGNGGGAGRGARGSGRSGAHMAGARQGHAQGAGRRSLYTGCLPSAGCLGDECDEAAGTAAAPTVPDERSLYWYLTGNPAFGSHWGDGGVPPPPEPATLIVRRGRPDGLYEVPVRVPHGPRMKIIEVAPQAAAQPGKETRARPAHPEPVEGQRTDAPSPLILPI